MPVTHPTYLSAYHHTYFHILTRLSQPPVTNLFAGVPFWADGASINDPGSTAAAQLTVLQPI